MSTVGSLYVHGPEHEPAALVFAALVSALSDAPALLLWPGPGTRHLLSALFAEPDIHTGLRTNIRTGLGTDLRTDLCHCPCAPRGSGVVRRVAAHVSHGGSVVLPSADTGCAREDRQETEELMSAAVTAGARVHALGFRQLRTPAAEIFPPPAPPALPRACRHRVGAPLSATALREDAWQAIQQALRTLAEPSAAQAGSGWFGLTASRG
ncbi:hypothetical protein A6A06_15290 [Streptomyces sp. CB02923]|nr:hypothetical protein A6A06_15290 [Streptomyces sp. CB02923]